MLATLGDLVDDIVVMLGGPVRLGTDTDSTIRRRRGGSAANVAATASSLGHPVRFLGQVGDDPIGRMLVAELGSAGVDTASVRYGGSTGSIVVLVDEAGERHMLTDRGASTLLAAADPTWLDGVTTLHVPLYSFASEPLRSSALGLVELARGRGIAVSIDLSSSALIESLGAETVRDLLTAIHPDVVFANGDEATALAGPTSWAQHAVLAVKHGADPAVVTVPGDAPVVVPGVPIDRVDDTTGAGDAFAAGFLTAPDWQHDPVAACRVAHSVAARHITTLSTTT